MQLRQPRTPGRAGTVASLVTHSRLVRQPFGRPLRRAELSHQVLAKRYALPVFASDNLSSVAYATEEILVVLALAGTSYFAWSIWIALAIMAGYAVIIISYRQTLSAYPNGGGSYIVSRDNLGEGVAQVAGAALLVDYILTVSVSIASGVANFSSGIHQFLPGIPVFSTQARVITSLLLLALMWYVNKRGLKESGRAFALPAYFFLVSVFLMLGVGLVKGLTGQLGDVQDVHGTIEATQSMTLLLLLRAYASGNTAVTGVEAISNGIPAFADPKPKNAAITMAIMGSLVAVMFLGITQLAHVTHAQASESETVISQLGRTVFSAHSPFYVAVIFGTAAILILAANTSFVDFPRLAALQAGDRFLPGWLMDRDNRLVFGVGISVLSVAAGALLIVFQASVTHLIPLYAVGVFLSITLSQAGMAVHWRRSGRLRPGEQLPRYSPDGELVTTIEHDGGWHWKLALSAAGATMTAVITCIFAVAKFTQGAWIIVIVIPTLLVVFFRIHRHYRTVQRAMTLQRDEIRPYLEQPVVTLHLLVVAGLQRHTLPALREFVHMPGYGGMRQAVHVDVNEQATAELRQQWRELGIDAMGLPLVILPSHYGAGDVIDTLVSYVRGALSVDDSLRVEVVITDWASNTSWWGWLLTPALHHLTGARLRLAFLAEDRATVKNYRTLTSRPGLPAPSHRS
ncbi:MAG: APC family permease [Dehalococcoidia bacterium]|nr:APC family permease [Dehalococcoidia bacterium]